jgi:hypothetical protein
MDKHEVIGVLKTIIDFEEGAYVIGALEMAIKIIETAELPQKVLDNSITPCKTHGRAGIRLVTKVVCADCGEPVDRIFVNT